MQDTPNPSAPAQTPAPETRKRGNPYRVFFWSALVMAGLCFWIGTQRLAIQRPARADAYFITGILGILSAAMAFSLGAAHERARRSQQSLQDSVDRLQDRMQDMPRALMEESVKVAEREAAGRRADQERQARELRQALEDGMKSGFAPLAPALSDRIAASLGGLSEALRQDREERAAVLRATSEAVASLRAAQDEWAKASGEALAKLKAQGESILAGAESRDAEGRVALQAVAADSARALREALDMHLGKTGDLIASLTAKWEEARRAQDAAFASHLEKADGLAGGLASRWDESRRAQDAAFEAHLAKVGDLTGALAAKWEESLKAHGDALREFSGQAGERLRENAARAEEWLGNLSSAAERIGEALEAVRRGGEESAALQAEWRATVEMFHTGLGGLLDRLQSLAAYAQGQEALLLRMDETIRSFEERSAELIEDTALKAQESLLEALDQAGSRDAAIAEEGTQA